MSLTLDYRSSKVCRQGMFFYSYTDPYARLGLADVLELLIETFGSC